MEIRVARWCKIERIQVIKKVKSRHYFIECMAHKEREIHIISKCRTKENLAPKKKVEDQESFFRMMGFRSEMTYSDFFSRSFLSRLHFSTWRWWTGPPLMIVCAQGPLGFFIASSLKEWKDFCTFSIAKPTWDAEVGGGGRRCWIAWASWLKA